MKFKMTNIVFILLASFSMIGCGITPISPHYLLSDTNRKLVGKSQDAQLHVHDERDEKIFFQSVIFKGGDDGQGSPLRLERPPSAIFEEGFTQGLQNLGFQVLPNAELGVDVHIKRFLVTEQAPPAPFQSIMLEGEIILEVIISRNGRTSSSTQTVSRDFIEKGFASAWQEPVTRLFNMTITQAVEKTLNNSQVQYALGLSPATTEGNQYDVAKVNETSANEYKGKAIEHDNKKHNEVNSVSNIIDISLDEKEELNKIDKIECYNVFSEEGTFFEVRIYNNVIIGPFRAELKGNIYRPEITIKDGARTGGQLYGEMQLKDNAPVFVTTKGQYIITGYYLKEYPNYLYDLAKSNRSIVVIGFEEDNNIEAVCIQRR